MDILDEKMNIEDEIFSTHSSKEDELFDIVSAGCPVGEVVTAPVLPVVLFCGATTPEVPGADGATGVAAGACAEAPPARRLKAAAAARTRWRMRTFLCTEG